MCVMAKDGTLGHVDTAQIKFIFSVAVGKLVLMTNIVQIFSAIKEKTG